MSLPQRGSRAATAPLATSAPLKIVRAEAGDETVDAGRFGAPTLYWPVGFLILGVVAFRWDLAVTNNLSYLDLPGDIGRLLDYSEVFGHGVGVVLCCLLAGLLDPRGARVTGYLLAHAFGAGLFADVFKLFLVRLRPHHASAAWDSFTNALPSFAYPWQNDFTQSIRSFPSGHAAVAAGLAIGLCRLYPRGKPLFILFAGLAALQRVTAYAHYPSDCLIGFAIAFAWCYLMYLAPARLHSRLLVEPM